MVIDLRRASLDVADEGESGPDQRVVRIPVFDPDDGPWRADPGLLDDALRTISHHIDAGEIVLVRCASGVERSPAVVVAWRVRRLGLSPAEAYARVRTNRPQVVEELDIIPFTYEERTR